MAVGHRRCGCKDVNLGEYEKGNKPAVTTKWEVVNIKIRWFFTLGIFVNFVGLFYWFIWTRKTISKFAIRRPKTIRSSVVSSSEGKAATCLTFRQTLAISQSAYWCYKGLTKFYTKENCDQLRHTFGDSQESCGNVIMDWSGALKEKGWWKVNL